ncbi:MAG: alpha/beta hydrolase [Chloroflexi bacterium]|nr:alpha/beta hydrolase [Chloroflexota bacterium]
MKSTYSIPTHPSGILPKFRAAHPYRQLELDDGSWRYIAAGSGRKTLLLLPGAFVGAEMWLHLITSLQDRYRILTLDNPPKAITLAEMNAALVRLLDNENIQRITLLGYSAGGGLAQAFMQSHSDRVEDLILSHCTPLSADAAHRLDRMAGLLKLLPIPFIRVLFKKRSSRYLSNSAWADFTRAFFAERIATLKKEDLLLFVQSGVEAARTFQFDSQALQNWAGRILLMSSKDDATTFPRLDEMQVRYRSAQTHVFEQGGHHTLLLFPEIYNSTLAGFLEALP